MGQMAKQKGFKGILLLFVIALLASLLFSLSFFFYSQSLLNIHFEQKSLSLKALKNMKGPLPFPGHTV